jgi:hypothetical protein
MASISISLSPEALDRLRDLARQEFRTPREQAVALIIEALSRRAPVRSSGRSRRSATTTPVD